MSRSRGVGSKSRPTLAKAGYGRQTRDAISGSLARPPQGPLALLPRSSAHSHLFLTPPSPPHRSAVTIVPHARLPNRSRRDDERLRHLKRSQSSPYQETVRPPNTLTLPSSHLTKPHLPLQQIQSRPHPQRPRGACTSSSLSQNLLTDAAAVGLTTRTDHRKHPGPSSPRTGLLPLLLLALLSSC